jgi:hypothetical protein
MSNPAKALATCVIMTLAIGMVGALGQIIIHDIIPTFFSESSPTKVTMTQEHQGSDHKDQSDTVPEAVRGDLFEDLATKDSESSELPVYKTDQFIWTLKWTHIHLFGINMIFIFMGGITYFLDMSSRARTWLIVLPFLGILIDIIAMWLKAYISPSFFWLHVPGGGLFAIVFGFVSLRALWEMWLLKDKEQKL